jgi:hypothetical protein
MLIIGIVKHFTEPETLPCLTYVEVMQELQGQPWLARQSRKYITKEHHFRLLFLCKERGDKTSEIKPFTSGGWQSLLYVKATKLVQERCALAQDPKRLWRFFLSRLKSAFNQNAMCIPASTSACWLPGSIQGGVERTGWIGWSRDGKFRENPLTQTRWRPPIELEIGYDRNNPLPNSWRYTPQPRVCEDLCWTYTREEVLNERVTVRWKSIVSQWGLEGVLARKLSIMVRNQSEDG